MGWALSPPPSPGWPPPPRCPAPTCLSEREVVFGVVHAQDRVVVGGRRPALGRGALVQRAVLRLPGEKGGAGQRLSDPGGPGAPAVQAECPQAPTRAVLPLTHGPGLAAASWAAGLLPGQDQNDGTKPLGSPWARPPAASPGPVGLRTAGPRGCTLGPIPGLCLAPLVPVSPGLAVLRLRRVLPPATEGPVRRGGRQGLQVQGTQVLLEAAETWPGPVGPVRPVLAASGSWRAGATWGRAPSRGQSPQPSPLPRGRRHPGPWELIPGNLLPL